MLKFCMESCTQKILGNKTMYILYFDIMYGLIPINMTKKLRNPN